MTKPRYLCYRPTKSTFLYLCEIYRPQPPRVSYTTKMTCRLIVNQCVHMACTQMQKFCTTQ